MYMQDGGRGVGMVRLQSGVWKGGSTRFDMMTRIEIENEIMRYE